MRLPVLLRHLHIRVCIAALAGLPSLGFSQEPQSLDPAVAAEEHVTFEVKETGGVWVSRSRTQLSIYFVQGNSIARELQYWAPRQ